MEFLILAVLLGLIPAVIASQKGHPFATWWLFGALLFIVALPLAIIQKPSEDKRRQCPHCRTWIDRQASVCAQCARDVEPAAAVAAVPVKVETKLIAATAAAVGVLLIVVLVANI